MVAVDDAGTMSSWSATRMPEPAPPSKVAAAARSFGDEYPPLRGQWRIRAAGMLLVAATLFYTPWMLGTLNARVPWLAWPFAAANLFSMGDVRRARRNDPAHDRIGA